MVVYSLTQSTDGSLKLRNSLLYQVSVMRPPNYTLLMIWIPVIVLATIIGYLKRENLHMLYNTRYWAVAALVR